MTAFKFDSPFDQVMAESNPLMPMPKRSTLPALDVGRHRYLLAADGIYFEARSRAVHAVVKVGDAELPFGIAKPSLTLGDGTKIPQILQDQAIALARAAMPNEWAGVIVWRKGAFQLLAPETILANRGAIKYSTAGIDPLEVALDIHSHNSMDAYFSSQDDLDDRANATPVFTAMVLGRLDQPKPQVAMRAVVHGRFYTMALQPMKPGNEPEPLFE